MHEFVRVCPGICAPFMSYSPTVLTAQLEDRKESEPPFSLHTVALLSEQEGWCGDGQGGGKWRRVGAGGRESGGSPASRWWWWRPAEFMFDVLS